MEVERTSRNSSTKRSRENRDKKKKVVLAVLWATLASWRMQVVAAAAVMLSGQSKRESKRRRNAERAHYLSTLTTGREEECISQLRLNKASFDYLCELLRVRGLLQDSREVTVEEEVAACLHILAHAVKNRTIASRFMRSGETVSRHFHGVLNAILTLSPNFIRPAGQHTPSGPPNFQNCVGAIDGTHIPAFLPLHAQPPYRNWKGALTQNVLAACGFDLKFQYVLPGWEGSATDARILHNALSRNDPLVVPPVPHVPQRKNHVFNAEMDEQLLELMLEQVAMGRKGDRGFKDEAYVAVASAMTATNKVGKVLTETTIRNRCKNLKKQYAVCTELLNASGFGFDNATKRIVATDEVWRDWLVGHPDARSWRSKTIDYDKLSLVFGRDVATGHFARSSQNATPVYDSQSRTNTQNMSGNVEIGLEDCLDEMRMGSHGGGESSSGSRKRMRKGTSMAEFITGFKEASAVISKSIEEVAHKMLDPSERLSESIAAELEKIPELSPADLDMAHEWLNTRSDSSTAFLHSKDKSAWIFRRLERIHRETGL